MQVVDNLYVIKHFSFFHLTKFPEVVCLCHISPLLSVLSEFTSRESKLLVMETVLVILKSGVLQQPIG